jgi:hypothetical protein
MCDLNAKDTRRRLMKKKCIFLFLSLFSGIFISSCTNASMSILESDIKATPGGKVHSNIMLVLGSSDHATRAARIALACDLIKRNDIHFDRIILSGGCGAHGTDKSNCEASDMQRLLEAACGDEISGIRIYREENSGSTVQNYCYSSNLQDNGEDLIRKEDTLYVVSSHYHALSVAACFKNDGVDAHYYYTCGGALYDGVPPSVAAVAASNTPCYEDYSGIAQNCGTPGWCESQQLRP